MHSDGIQLPGPVPVVLLRQYAAGDIEFRVLAVDMLELVIGDIIDFGLFHCLQVLVTRQLAVEALDRNHHVPFLHEPGADLFLAAEVVAPHESLADKIDVAADVAGFDEEPFSGHDPELQDSRQVFAQGG